MTVRGAGAVRLKLYRDLMVASVLPVRVAPLGNGSNKGLVVANGLAVATANRMPICRDDDGRLHLTRGFDDERSLSYARELVVQPTATVDMGPSPAGQADSRSAEAHALRERPRSTATRPETIFMAGPALELSRAANRRRLE